MSRVILLLLLCVTVSATNFEQEESFEYFIEANLSDPPPSFSSSSSPSLVHETGELPYERWSSFDRFLLSFSGYYGVPYVNTPYSIAYAVGTICPTLSNPVYCTSISKCVATQLACVTNTNLVATACTAKFPCAYDGTTRAGTFTATTYCASSYESCYQRRLTSTVEPCNWNGYTVTCWDGSCVASVLDCPSFPSCPAGSVRCINGTCQTSVTACPSITPPTCPTSASGGYSPYSYCASCGFCMLNSTCATSKCDVNLYPCPSSAAGSCKDTVAACNVGCWNPDYPLQAQYKCWNNTCAQSLSLCPSSPLDYPPIASEATVLVTSSTQSFTIYDSLQRTSASMWFNSSSFGGYTNTTRYYYKMVINMRPSNAVILNNVVIPGVTAASMSTSIWSYPVNISTSMTPTNVMTKCFRTSLDYTTLSIAYDSGQNYCVAKVITSTTTTGSVYTATCVSKVGFVASADGGILACAQTYSNSDWMVVSATYTPSAASRWLASVGVVVVAVVVSVVVV